MRKMALTLALFCLSQPVLALSGKPAGPIPFPTANEIASPRLAHSDGVSCYDEDHVFKRCLHQGDLFDLALRKAKSENKRLLLVFGYDNCGWSRAMMNLLTFSSKAAIFHSKYVVQPIASSSGNSTGKELVDGFLRADGYENKYSFPFLVMIDPTTGVRTYLQTAELERNQPSIKWQGQDLEKLSDALLR